MVHQGRGHVAAYLDAIRSLAPLVAVHRDAIDRERRLPEVVFAALAAAGLFRLWLPRACGGPELDPLEFLEVVEAAAGLDGSIGWLVGNGGVMSRAGGYLARDVADEWFADERAFVVAATGAVGTAVVVEGGYRVTGRWPFGSGRISAPASWACADRTPGRPRLHCTAASDVRVIDDWHVSGLRGTGSCDFAAETSRPPIAILQPQRRQPSRMPQLSVFPDGPVVPPASRGPPPYGRSRTVARQGSLTLRDQVAVGDGGRMPSSAAPRLPGGGDEP
jgi:alkylation response protein AidB-like acyl-CoA dehydrogenase